MDVDDPLALEHQVCFALAVASRSVVAAYRPVLEPLGLSHPQYLVMLALWERDGQSLKDLSSVLHLEPATASPLVKRLEAVGLVARERSAHDERTLTISLTSAGRGLREEALRVPETMLARLGMTVDELVDANTFLHRLISAAQHASDAFPTRSPA
ncbi:MarR family transcriptional regulator [Mumia zhuanghuii]|uniref:MarR family winged helix-turn-helix transcriptional regulator n=2 Tax=Mumia TaxID=1546255 RepID=A0ABW1QR07_9ACTN|nr:MULTISPECIES: MarR family transcriptional regulator [Mumia]KAA1422949.1 MarR family transcriptional regulator [Mumia zhuanghuii]